MISLPLLTHRGPKPNLLLLRLDRFSAAMFDTERKSLRMLRVSSENPEEEVFSWEEPEFEKIVIRFVRNFMGHKYRDIAEEAARRERNARQREKEARWAARKKP